MAAPTTLPGSGSLSSSPPRPLFSVSESFATLTADEEEANARSSKLNQDLVFVNVRSRNQVSTREDDTDGWGENELNAKTEWKLMITDPESKSTILTRLNTFRKNRELCDVSIFVREREIVGHRAVLAALSPVLLDKFRRATEVHEGNKTPTTPLSPGERLTFELNFVHLESFLSLINYAYTSKLVISNRHVADLYKTSHELEVHPIANACARYLADNLSVQSCIGIRRHANFNKDIFLVEKVDRFIQENIHSIITDSTEFSNLSCIQTRVIIPTLQMQASNIGQVMGEKTLKYFSLFTWPTGRNDLQLDTLAGKKHLLYIDEAGELRDCVNIDDANGIATTELVRDYKRRDGVKRGLNVKDPVGAEATPHHVNGAIRLNPSGKAEARFASNESLNSVDNDDNDEIELKHIVTAETSSSFYVTLAVLYRKLVKISIQLTDDDEIIREQVRKAYEANGPNSLHASTVSNASTTSPLSSSPPTELAATLEATPRLSVDAANLIQAAASRIGRIPLPPMSVARCSNGAVVLGDKIVICGGYDRGECLKSVEQYDVELGTWSALPDMWSERGRFDTAMANGIIYAVAGSSGNKDLATAEALDPVTNKWFKIPSLALARSQNACASLDGLIYCIGGTYNGSFLRESERYNPETAEWQFIAPMQVPRSQSAACSWRGLIIALGGSDRWSVLDSVEAYDPKTDTWRFLAKLKTPRRGCAIAVVGEALYAIGGHDGNGSLASVEILDQPAGEWRLGPPMLTPRANTHAVVTRDSVVYVIGGFNANHFLSSIELLESEAIGWRNWQQNTPQQQNSQKSSIEQQPPPAAASCHRSTSPTPVAVA